MPIPIGLPCLSAYNGPSGPIPTLDMRCCVMRSSLLALPILLFAVAGPGPAQEPTTTPYFPLKAGYQWTYRAGKEQVVVQVEKQVTLEFKRNEKGPLETATGFELKMTSPQGKFTEQVAVLDDGVYRFSSAGKTIKPPLRILKLGTKGAPDWTVDSKTEEGKTISGKFVLGQEKLRLTINGKAIDLDTYTATCKEMQVDDQQMSITYWYAKDYGLVKRHVKIGNTESTQELEQFKTAP